MLPGLKKIMMHQKNKQPMRIVMLVICVLIFSSCSLFRHNSSKDMNGLSCNGLHGRNTGAEKLLSDDNLAKKMPKYKMDKINN
jgi:hypothetical protein